MSMETKLYTEATAEIVALADSAVEAIFSGGWNKSAGSIAVQPDGRVDWSPAFNGGVSTEATAILHANFPPGHPALRDRVAMKRALLASIETCEDADDDCQAVSVE